MVKAIKAAQLADQIRDYLAQWSSEDLFVLFYSITQVTLETDMLSATIWVDVLRPEDETKVMRELTHRQGEYQHKLQRVLQRRTIPRITFKLDEGESLGQRMDDLLKGTSL